MICPNCEGEKFSTHTFEGETSRLPCQACKGKGKVSDKKYFMQTYEQKNWLNRWSVSVYHGPCLDYRDFRKLKIIFNESPKPDPLYRRLFGKGKSPR